MATSRPCSSGYSELSSSNTSRAASLSYCEAKADESVPFDGPYTPYSDNLALLPFVASHATPTTTFDINKTTADSSYTSDSNNTNPSHVATSGNTSSTCIQDSDENAMVKDISHEGTISVDSDSDDDTYYAEFKSYITTYLIHDLDLPPPKSIFFICQGGSHYVFAIEYPTSFQIQNDERCRSEPSIKTVLLPAKLILRVPIYEMDMALRPDNESIAFKATLSELKDRAAKNLFASIDSNGLGGPKIFAYDCDCAVPYLLMEFIPGQDLEIELPNLNSEDIYTVSDLWAADALVYRKITFDGPGNIIAHSDVSSRDWPCFWTKMPANVIQLEPIFIDSQETLSDYRSQPFLQQLIGKLDSSEKQITGPQWAYYSGKLDMLHKVPKLLKIPCSEFQSCLYNQDPEPRNIIIERSVNGEIKRFRRIDFDDLGTVPLLCGIRSAWPTMTRCPAFPAKWPEDEKANLARTALNLVLDRFPDMDRESVEFNDFLFGYFRVLQMDLRDENAWNILEELDEAWSTRWEALYEAGSVLYAGHGGSTEDHSQDVNMNNPIDGVSRIATGE